MASNVSGITSADGFNTQDFVNNNLSQNMTFPGGEYNKRSFYYTNDFVNSDVPLEYNDELPVDRVSQDSTMPGLGNASQLVGIAGMTQQTPSVGMTGDTPQKSTTPATATTILNRDTYIKARAAVSALNAIGGVVNAQAKYQNIVNTNNYNIAQAQMQADSIRSATAEQVLKEQTKGEIRAGKATLNAVAQGQAAGGDLAKTLSNNEKVYAAQNAMNLETNSMRTIFGLESKIGQMNYENDVAEVNKNYSQAQAMIGAIPGFYGTL